MKRVLLVCAHRPNRSPSQRYRFEQYLPYLESQGYSFTWSYLIKEHEDQKFYSAGNYFLKAKILLRAYLIRYKDLLRMSQFDIVFEQRESLFTGSAFFERAVFAKKIPLIFDFDDSIWMADTSPANKKFEWLKEPKKIYEVFDYATVVIAGNSILARRAKEYTPDVVIIPTTIDTNLHVPIQKPKASKIRIGWSGSISTIKHFLLLLPVLSRLKMKYGNSIEVAVLADKPYSSPEQEIVSLIWSPDTEVAHLNTFDIGVMPLPDDAWSQGKCGLKGLSYMACGIPTVMSAVGVNSEIISHQQNGFLAEDENEWYDCLCALIDNAALRKQIGEKGRATVLERYSVEANKQKYLQVFERAQST